MAADPQLLNAIRASKHRNSEERVRQKNEVQQRCPLNLFILTQHLQECDKLPNNNVPQVEIKEYQADQSAPESQAKDLRQCLQHGREALVSQRTLLATCDIHVELPGRSGPSLHQWQAESRVR